MVIEVDGASDRILMLAVPVALPEVAATTTLPGAVAVNTPSCVMVPAPPSVPGRTVHTIGAPGITVPEASFASALNGNTVPTTISAVDGITVTDATGLVEGLRTVSVPFWIVGDSGRRFASIMSTFVRVSWYTLPGEALAGTFKGIKRMVPLPCTGRLVAIATVIRPGTAVVLSMNAPPTGTIGPKSAFEACGAGCPGGVDWSKTMVKDTPLMGGTEETSIATSTVCPGTALALFTNRDGVCPAHGIWTAHIIKTARILSSNVVRRRIGNLLCSLQIGRRKHSALPLPACTTFNFMIPYVP
jgi:hypothetical protein